MLRKASCVVSGKGIREKSKRLVRYGMSIRRAAHIPQYLSYHHHRSPAPPNLTPHFAKHRTVSILSRSRQTRFENNCHFRLHRISALLCQGVALESAAAALLVTQHNPPKFNLARRPFASSSIPYVHFSVLINHLPPYHQEC